MITTKIKTKLENQINDEFHAAAMYLSISNWCGLRGFPGFQHWFRKQYEEELQHGLRINDYLIDRECLPLINTRTYDTIKEYSSLLGVAETGLASEKRMTKRLSDIYDLAHDSKDFLTTNMLQWFLNEQVEEERLFQDLVDAVSRCNDSALTLLDIEMAKRE